ncbi:DUF397 domain-containing protein [Sphaerisporangium rubeum]|uniref:DUF397 domain-containing protein n=1 Tax=Sphaerisporangium rubeum TaxID=321317 RepID=A0A7X0IAV8_9ACTN|nr:DUF397 domain-containing protein [Sphaerisporangium rubeum]MBB6471084.1 hypothetical protein [Sphaerisporangium rubeum]
MEELNWKKSSYSSANGGDCVEIATLPTDVVIRDSKAPSIGHLVVPAVEFGAFITALRGI